MKKSFKLLSIATAILLVSVGCESTGYDRHDVQVREGGDGISDRPGSITIINGDDSTTNDGNTTTPITSPEQNVTVKSADNVYSIQISPENDSLTSNQAQKIHYEIKDLLTGVNANDNNIEKIEFLVDDRFAKFIDYEGNEGDTFTLSGSKAKAIGDVAIKSLNNSGQVNVKFTVTINGITNSMIKRLPVVIVKNRSSSISLIPVPNYAQYDKYKNGLYIDKFTLHVVDKYGNKAKDGTYVHVGVVNNLKQDNGKNLYSPELGTKGTIQKTNNNFSFVDDRVLTDVNSDNEKSVDTQDTIVILANGERSDPRYLGGWRIGEISSDNKSLGMVDTYTWDDKRNLSFAIGDDKKFNQCDSTLANAAIYSDTDYKVKDGIVNVELRYDPYMIGKTVFLYANSLIGGERIGISRRVDLKGTGIEDMSYTCDASDSNVSVPCGWTGYLKFKDSGVAVKNVKVDRRVTDFGVLTPGNPFIACDSAAHEVITAPAGKKITVAVKYVIEPELPLP